MKQKPTLFGQAFQISELRQQVAGLEEQNKKLATEVKVLRESDRALFDAQEAMIDALQGVVRDYHAEIAIVLAMGTKAGDQRLQELQERAQSLLAEKKES